MKNNSDINWLNVISIREFLSILSLNLIKEISMASNIMREKLKPVLFKNLKLSLENIKFDSNVISIAYDMQHHYSDYDYKALKDENNGCIENSINEIISDINNIKEYTKSFYLMYNRKAGYYLCPLIKVFDNLTHLKIFICDFPFDALADIGNTCPNLNNLELEDIDLVKSDTDITSERDIAFPPKLTYLKIFQVQVVTSNILSDPFEYLFNTKVLPTSYEYFTLPKISIPTLKRLDFIPKGEKNRGIEEFLDVNPSVEYLYTYNYNLNITGSLNSLRTLKNEDLITFGNIYQGFRLNFIDTLILSTTNFNYSENIRRLCQLCPNLVDLSIRFSGTIPDFQHVIDNYLVPSLSNSHRLKALTLAGPHVDINNITLDFSKFAQIEKLKLELDWRPILNIKFNSCKSLKRIKLKTYFEKFTDEFKTNFNNFNNWKFKFNGRTIEGYKI